MSEIRSHYKVKARARKGGLTTFQGREKKQNVSRCGLNFNSYFASVIDNNCNRNRMLRAIRVNEKNM